jgi:hypothetical protein
MIHNLFSLLNLPGHVRFPLIASPNFETGKPF